MMPSVALAVTDCSFTTIGTVMKLDADCTTDTTILVPDGFTLDGNGRTITAVDPVAGHFMGAVVKNGGAAANVQNLVVTTSELADVCDAGGDRLRGIMFEGASGSITHNTVLNINQGLSGCQEGNAIEIRNEPFDGTHPNTMTVEVSHNSVYDWQKTGIVSNGDVDVNVHHNNVGNSFSDMLYIAGNGIQFGFGATGSSSHNNIEGNQWCGPSDFAATAILIFEADGVELISNKITGNSDIGMYLFGDGLTADKNKVSDDDLIADCNQFGYDIGIGNYGSGNSINKNMLSGFDTSFDGPVDEKNKVRPDN
jgi:hypothetical protein